MKNEIAQPTQIIIGPSSDKPAIVMRESFKRSELKNGRNAGLDSSMGQFLAALQSVPEL